MISKLLFLLINQPVQMGDKYVRHSIRLLTVRSVEKIKQENQFSTSELKNEN